MTSGDLKYRWTMLFLATYVVTVYGFVLQSIPPILNHLIATLSLTYSQAGALMGGFAMPAMVLAIPIGFLLDKLGVRKVALTGLIVFLLGTGIVAATDNYALMLAGRVVSGAGAVALIIFAPRILAEWFAGAELGLAMGVFNTAVPVGTLIAMLSLGVLADRQGWEMVLMVSALASTSALVCYLLLHRDRAVAIVQPPTSGGFDLKRYLREAGKPIWYLGIGWAIFAAGYFQYFTFATDYFVGLGFTPKKAGLYASAPMFCGIPAAPIVGWLLDKFGRGWVFVLVGYIGLVVTLALIPIGGNYVMWVILGVGTFGGLVPTAVFMLPPSLMPAHTLGFGYGLLAAMLGVGGLFGPLVLGLLRDITGVAGSVFYGAAALTLLAIPPTLLLRKTS